MLPNKEVGEKDRGPNPTGEPQGVPQEVEEILKVPRAAPQEVEKTVEVQQIDYIVKSPQVAPQEFEKIAKDKQKQEGHDHQDMTKFSYPAAPSAGQEDNLRALAEVQKSFKKKKKNRKARSPLAFESVEALEAEQIVPHEMELASEVADEEVDETVEVPQVLPQEVDQIVEVPYAAPQEVEKIVEVQKVDTIDVEHFATVIRDGKIVKMPQVAPRQMVEFQKVLKLRSIGLEQRLLDEFDSRDYDGNSTLEFGELKGILGRSGLGDVLTETLGTLDDGVFVSYSAIFDAVEELQEAFDGFPQPVMGDGCEEIGLKEADK